MAPMRRRRCQPLARMCASSSRRRRKRTWPAPGSTSPTQRSTSAAASASSSTCTQGHLAARQLEVEARRRGRELALGRGDALQRQDRSDGGAPSQRHQVEQAVDHEDGERGAHETARHQALQLVGLVAPSEPGGAAGERHQEADGDAFERRDDEVADLHGAQHEIGEIPDRVGDQPQRVGHEVARGAGWTPAARWPGRRRPARSRRRAAAPAAPADRGPGSRTAAASPWSAPRRARSAWPCRCGRTRSGRSGWARTRGSGGPR